MLLINDTVNILNYHNTFRLQIVALMTLWFCQQVFLALNFYSFSFLCLWNLNVINFPQPHLSNTGNCVDFIIPFLKLKFCFQTSLCFEWFVKVWSNPKYDIYEIWKIWILPFISSSSIFIFSPRSLLLDKNTWKNNYTFMIMYSYYTLKMYFL